MTSKPESFKTGDICAIIEACSKNGIREFSFQGLKLSLGAKPVVAETQTIEYEIPPEVMQKVESQTRETRVQEEVLIKKDELERMLIEDPDAYFDAIKLGDLVDEKGT